MRSIRLNDKDAAKYGIRVLLPSAAGYADFTGKKPAVAATPEPPTEPQGPSVTHEIREDGTWVVTRDGVFFADGDNAEDIPQVVALAESGGESFAPSFDVPSFDVPGRPALEKNGIKSVDDLRAYVDGGGVLTDIKGIGEATAVKLLRVI